MSAATDLLAFRDVYREDAATEESVAHSARRHLVNASDALSMAMLALSGNLGERSGKLARAEQARTFLLEAATSLSRARVYVPGIRTHSLQVVMAWMGDADAELVRLNHIATRLLWQNHKYLPARLQAKPLAPEDEAQLANVVRGLAPSGKIKRALRDKWSAIVLVVFAFALAVSFPVTGVSVGAVGIGLIMWQMFAGGSSNLPPLKASPKAALEAALPAETVP
jgi:hypothetical protein